LNRIHLTGRACEFSAHINKNLIILFDSGTIGLYLGSTNEQIFESEEPDHIFLISDKIIHFSYFFHEHVNFVLVSGQNVKNIII